jgi:threonine dehydrogenase-like Zn-dependent dehydrogenase
MTANYQHRESLKLPESNKVVVVGAGPVGLVASLLLSNYHVPHVLVEQLAEPDAHPQTHFIPSEQTSFLAAIFCSSHAPGWTHCLAASDTIRYDAMIEMLLFTNTSTMKGIRKGGKHCVAIGMKPTQKI